MSIRSTIARKLVRVRLAAVHAGLFLAACATSPPVQEMSDARQAIAAAEEARAADFARERLDDARRFLETAEQQLRDEQYGAARLNAIRARNRAVEALEASQEAARQREDVPDDRSPE